MNSSSQGTKTDWSRVIGFVMFVLLAVYGYHSTRTGKETISEASGQKPVSSTESDSDRAERLFAKQILLLRKDLETVDADFTETYTESHLLKPETLTSPAQASESFHEVKAYCDSERAIVSKTRTTFQNSRVTMDGWMSGQYDAALSFCSALENFYAYAAVPSHEIGVENGVVHIVGVKRYNELIDKVNESVDRLRIASKTFDEEQGKWLAEQHITQDDLNQWTAVVR